MAYMNFPLRNSYKISVISVRSVRY